MHVLRKDTKECRKAGLHHAEFHRDHGVIELGVYKWMMRRARGHETRVRWNGRMRNVWKEWVAKWGIRRTKPRRQRGAGAVQAKVLDRGESEKASPGILLCATLGLKGPRGEQQTRVGNGTMSMRICSGETTSRCGQGRGTSAGDAQRRQGRHRGRS